MTRVYDGHDAPELGVYSASSPPARPAHRSCPKAQRRSVPQRPSKRMEAHPRACSSFTGTVWFSRSSYLGGCSVSGPERLTVPAAHPGRTRPRSLVPAIWLPSVQNKKSPRTVSFVGRFACVGVFLLSGSLEVKSFGQSEGACYFDRICQIPLRGRGPRTPPQQGPPRPLPHPCQLRVLSKAVVCQAVRCNWHLAVGLMCFSVIISEDGHRVVC